MNPNKKRMLLNKSDKLYNAILGDNKEEAFNLIAEIKLDLSEKDA